jgi:hypothetical protein
MDFTDTVGILFFPSSLFLLIQKQIQRLLELLLALKKTR